jgi:hypothetical protein
MSERGPRARWSFVQTIEKLAGLIIGALGLLVGYLIGLLNVGSVAASVGVIVGVLAVVSLVVHVSTREALNEFMAEATQSARRVEELFFRHFSSSASTWLEMGSRTSDLCIISEKDVVRMEDYASEVWIYSFDMPWDYEQTAIADVFRRSLERGCKYRYLVPNTLEALSGVRALMFRHSDIRDLPVLLQFRVRGTEVPFAKFGIGIYNPQLLVPHRKSVSTPTTVIFYPHFAPSSTGGYPFLRLSAQAANEHAREFDELWRAAKPIDMSEILRDCGTVGVPPEAGSPRVG